MATIEETKADLSALIALNKPAFVWGKTGVGKSEIVSQIALADDARVCDVRLSTFDPVDLRGLPAIIDGLTQWMRPQIWPAKEGENVYLFFDEMDRAATSVANAALQIVLDRRIGEHVLPKSVRVIAAGNGTTDKRGTNQISSAQANRFTHLYVEPDAETAARHWMNVGLHPVMAAFIRYRPALIHADAAKDEHGNPSPRAWASVAGMLQLPDAQRSRLIAGTVGKGAAGEFEAFFRVWRELPPLDSLIANPDTAPVPDQPGGLYAVASALARKANAGNFGKIITYVSRMPREFGIMAVTEACRQNPALKETSAYIGWHVDNQDITL